MEHEGLLNLAMVEWFIVNCTIWGDDWIACDQHPSPPYPQFHHKNFHRITRKRYTSGTVNQDGVHGEGTYEWNTTTHAIRLVYWRPKP